MAARWTERELTTLSQNLVDGFSVPDMWELLHNRRTEGAIIQKALKHNFRIETSDGITRFYHGVTRRRGGRRSAATNVDQIAVATDVPALAAEPQSIIPYNGLSANALAIQMLREKNLSINPDIVHTLSVHILQGGNS